VLVDDDALYVGLEYDDPTPGTILAPLARRDDETTSDWAFVEIDSRHDRRSGFSFGVNPRGVQVDGLWIADTAYDSAWNSVWAAAAKVGERGWTAEFRIPFANLAFALPRGATELLWGVNFYRYTPGHKASSNWSPRYQGLGGVVSRFNDLVVPAPSHVNRLEATPVRRGARRRRRGGRRPPRGRRGLLRRSGIELPPHRHAVARLRAGRGRSVASQPHRLRALSGRTAPFFLEGVGLFRFDTSLAFSTREASFGNEAPFYSRRVGEAPRGGVPADAEVIARPAETSLLGAAKLVGDTASGWTLGTFAAVSDDAQAIIRHANGRRDAWAIGPRSTLGVARAVRSSRDGRTSYGFFATRFDRQGLTEQLADELVRSTSTLGLDLRHRFGGEAYETRVWLLGSRLDGSPEALRRVQTSARHLFQRPDSAVRVENDARSLSGLAGEASVARINGGFRWSLTGRGVQRRDSTSTTPATSRPPTGCCSSAPGATSASRKPEVARGRKAFALDKLRTWAVGSDSLGGGWTTAGERRAGLVSAYLYGETRETAYAKLTVSREVESASVTWLRAGRLSSCHRATR
jgi:hypothetical protein